MSATLLFNIINFSSVSLSHNDFVFFFALNCVLKVKKQANLIKHEALYKSVDYYGQTIIIHMSIISDKVTVQRPIVNGTYSYTIDAVLNKRKAFLIILHFSV